VDVRDPFDGGRLAALWAHLKVPEGSHCGCQDHSIGPESSMPPSVGFHSRDTRMGLEHDC